MKANLQTIFRCHEGKEQMRLYYAAYKPGLVHRLIIFLINVTNHGVMIMRFKGCVRNYPTGLRSGINVCNKRVHGQRGETCDFVNKP
jgi:hypothetical protein